MAGPSLHSGSQNVGCRTTIYVRGQYMTPNRNNACFLREIPENYTTILHQVWFPQKNWVPFNACCFVQPVTKNTEKLRDRRFRQMFTSNLPHFSATAGENSVPAGSVGNRVFAGTFFGVWFFPFWDFVQLGDVSYPWSCHISKITVSLKSIVETYPTSKPGSLAWKLSSPVCSCCQQNSLDSKQRLRSETRNHQLSNFLHVQLNLSKKLSSLNKRRVYKLKNYKPLVKTNI